MSKPALGRGLGSLLSSRHLESTESPSSTTRVTPGVATLISGSQRAAGILPAEETFGRKAAELDLHATTRTTRLRWMLATADVALCGMAAAILLRSSSPVRPEEVALCVAAVLLGAWLGCGALTLGQERLR